MPPCDAVTSVLTSLSKEKQSGRRNNRIDLYIYMPLMLGADNSFISYQQDQTVKFKLQLGHPGEQTKPAYFAQVIKIVIGQGILKTVTGS